MSGTLVTDSLPDRMSAVLLTGHGGFENLDFREDVPRPAPVAGQVLIRVAAAGVNNTDINARIGWYSDNVTSGTTSEGGAGGIDADVADHAGWGGAIALPRIQGIDICGEIVAVGEGVAESRLGERVLVSPCFALPDGSSGFVGSEIDGGFAQFMVIDEAAVYRVQSNLTAVELASFPCSYSTAENMLTRGMLGAGETVLITGASGGVGSAAVQLAKRRGAEVIAVAGRAKVEAVRALGADRVIARGDSLLENLGPDSVDLVVDLVGGPQFPELMEVLKVRGRYAVSGAIAGPIVDLDLRKLYLKDMRMLGCTRLEAEVFGNLVDYIERGEIRPLVAESYPLRDIVRAQEAFLSKRHIGKIVLEIP